MSVDTDTFEYHDAADEREARLREVVRGLLLQHPHMDPIARRMRRLCASAVKCQGLEQDILFLIGPSSVGKTTAVTEGEKSCEAKGYGVLRATMSKDATQRQMACDLLNALNDPLGRTGDGSALLGRVRRIVDERQIRLIVIDEVVHLFRTMSATKLREVTQTIKSIAQWRTASLMLVGTGEARVLMHFDQQGSNRSTLPIVLDELQASTPSGAATISNQLAGLERAINDAEIFDRAVDFLRDDVFAHIVEHCRTLGQITQAIHHAGIVAIENGDDRLELDHLEAARELWRTSIPQDLRYA